MESQAQPRARSLTGAAQELLEAIEKLHPLKWRSAVDPRESASTLLKVKIIPELTEGLSLPVFVGVQGGTNTGKSTVFNALAGKLLSPAVVVASATKHPLFYVHSRWRDAFLGHQASTGEVSGPQASGRQIFPGLVIRELSDPRELITDAETTNVLYFRFHEDPRLAGLALIDSPDFDSSLASNAAQAMRIAAISDITLFVTTPEKYRDLVLVEELTRLLELKPRVVVVFNKVEEQVVFHTLFDDLCAGLSFGARPEAICLPPSRARHPEEELGDLLRERVVEPLSLLRTSEIKPAILARTLRKLLGLTSELLDAYSVEMRFKREVWGAAQAEARECVRGYVQDFSLSFPEETLAIRRVLRLTEIGRFLELGPEVEKASRLLALLGGSFRCWNDSIRRVLVRLSRGDQGSIEAAPTALAEYARARDKADSEAILRRLEEARVRVESLVRDREDVSPLSRQLLRSHFTSRFAVSFGDAVRSAHAEALESVGGAPADWVSAVERWIESHPLRVRLLSTTAIALKVGAGLLAAWALPPAQGLLSFLSPLKWLYFLGGYLAGAYAVALFIGLFLRKRRRFQRARERAAAETIRRVFERSLGEALDAIVRDEDLRRIEALTREIQGRPELTAPGPAHLSPTDGSGIDGESRARAP